MIKQRLYVDEDDEPLAHVAYQENVTQYKSPHWVIALAFLAFGVQLSRAAGACPAQQGVANWIDSSTAPDACIKRVCTRDYNTCISPGAPTEDLVLVFSDEFSRSQRNLVGQMGDRTWTAMDMYYSSDFAEQQNYKPEQVTIKNGALHLTMINKTTDAILNSVNGTKLVTMNVTSGMVQSWNKFCFTGGYAEFSIKLPGNAKDSGFWAAAWLEGNLGRAGYLKSTAGRWPYSYDECEGSGRLSWSGSPGQRTSRCSNPKGRGAPEIDVLEYGIFEADVGQAGTGNVPMYVHTMQMAPIAPLNTSYMLPDQSGAIPGIHIPGAADPARATVLGAPYGVMNKPGFPRAGSDLTDTYSGSSRLDQRAFEGYHTYSVLWEPGEYVRWYLDDEFLFELNKEALRAQTNDIGETIGQRLIPYEAMYLIINLAMSDKSWSKVSPNLVLPATMSVDYVRVYQRPSAVNIGCDPPDFPTQQEIACNKEEYLSPDELFSWKLGSCGSIQSQDNKILMGFSISVLCVAICTGGLWWLSWRASSYEKKNEGKLTVEEETAVRAGSKEAACYVTSNTFTHPDTIGATRPDLLEVARDRMSRARQ